MTIHQFCDPPPAALAGALAAFESQFTYPLGPGRRFRISHGKDYARLFRSMGQAACFVAERNQTVIGTLGAAIRQLLLPDGSKRAVAYLGDLKIAPAARGGRCLLRLMRAAQTWAGPAAGTAFGVVMDGTAAMPARYTGRLGIPPAHVLGKVSVLRLAGGPSSPNPAPDCTFAGAARGEACYERLSAGRYASTGGDPAGRSGFDPEWLVSADGSACGRLEDTSLAKRLITEDGAEMRSAHLSCFAFSDAGSGAALLRAALARAGRLGHGALFVAVAAPDAGVIAAALPDIAVLAAPATVFGTGLQAGPPWNINTSEI